MKPIYDDAEISEIDEKLFLKPKYEEPEKHEIPFECIIVECTMRCT